VVPTRAAQSFSKEVQFFPTSCEHRVAYLVIGVSDLELESTFLEHGDLTLDKTDRVASVYEVVIAAVEHVSLGEKWGRCTGSWWRPARAHSSPWMKKHTLCSPSEFRAGTGRLRERIRPVADDVTPPAIIMLTATAPPHAVAAIATVCGASQEGHSPKVVRVPSIARRLG
jgi:hypothetical protein